jgi:hypothetical protein
MKDDEVRTRILSLINGAAPIGHHEVLDLYGKLTEERGKNCGDHFLTVMQLVARGATADESERAISVLLGSHRPVKSIRASKGALVGSGIVLGVGGASYFLSDPIIKAFASVGIIGIVLLALLLLFKEPLSKAVFSKLNGAQTERIFKAILWIIAVAVILAMIGGVVVAIIESLKTGWK